MSIVGMGRGSRWCFGAVLVGLLMMAGVAFAEGEAEWTGEVSLSASNQSGTTDTFAGAFDANAQRASERDQVSVRLKADYGTTKRKDPAVHDRFETTQDSQSLLGGWKHTIHDRFFWESGSEVSRDSIQDRDIRVAVDTGPAYRFWRSDDEGTDHFDLMGGVGYRFEVYDGDGRDGFHFADLVGSFEYIHALFDEKIDYTHTGSVRAPANSFSDFIATSEIILGVPLTETWSFRTSFWIQYVNEVPDDIDELTTKATVGLGYKF